jgi:tetratricopeptide (TPR) repeat protein
VGLADIALGEALRRLSAIPDLYAPEECADLLREAEGYLNEAVEIFRPDGPVPEKPRLIEALIERGCLYRQWAWLRPLYEDEDPPQEELARRSERDLREAMELAGDEFPYRYLDAHVDLAWLYYYIRQEDRAEQEAREALKKVPTEYHFPLQTDPSQLPYTFYWFLMGKAYLLLGQVTERRFRSAKEKGRPKEEQQEFLRQVGEFYTIALACDEQFAQDFRDIRRAIRTIYDRLRRFNLEEMRAVHRGIADAVQKYGLSVPIRMDKVLADYTLPTRD